MERGSCVRTLRCDAVVDSPLPLALTTTSAVSLLSTDSVTLIRVHSAFSDAITTEDGSVTGTFHKTDAGIVLQLEIGDLKKTIVIDESN